MARLLILVVVTHLTRAADVDSCSGGHCAAASRSVLQTQAVTAAATEALGAAMEAVASQSALGGASSSHALPPGWRAMKNPGPHGKVYYRNDATGAMQWNKPVAATTNSQAENKLNILQSTLDCDFEASSCKWTDPAGGYGWEVNSHTPSRDTGPQRGGRSGPGSKFAYVEASGENAMKWFTLESPKINIDIPFRFEFWYNMYGRDMGKIVLILRDGRNTESLAWSKSGNLGDTWHLASVLVPAGTVQLIFQCQTGFTYLSDFALDDFSVKVATTKVGTTTTTTQAETTNILCGSGKFCVGVEGDDIFCYGAYHGCLWNMGCSTNDDCKKYTIASPKYSNPGSEICPSKGWMADACVKQPAPPPPPASSTKIKCGSGKFCVGVEGNDIFCYGANNGCLWNSGCSTNDDCKKYTSASPKYSNPGQEICPSKGWMADACA